MRLVLCVELDAIAPTLPDSGLPEIGVDPATVNVDRCLFPTSLLAYYSCRPPPVIPSPPHHLQRMMLFDKSRCTTLSNRAPSSRDVLTGYYLTIPSHVHPAFNFPTPNTHQHQD